MKAFWLCFPSIACDPLYDKTHPRTWAESKPEKPVIDIISMCAYGCGWLWCLLQHWLSILRVFSLLSFYLPPYNENDKDPTGVVANPVCSHVFGILPRRRWRFLQIDRNIRPLPYIGVDLCQNAPCSRPKVKFMIHEFHFSCKKRVLWGCFALRRPLQPTRYPEWPDVRW